MNAATLFITPDPPWPSDVPVVFAIMVLLIIIGLLHRIQTEPRKSGVNQKDRAAAISTTRSSWRRASRMGDAGGLMMDRSL